MPDIYLVIVILLFILAISDLIVGVSNDAVNFLNSAIGSKVAPRHIIMIVASLGIFVGATFSSGMMEVARKGIFNPEHFFLSEIMVLFLAVMLTDIILLDLFNTFGMPTSTTVSIVFELLGAAVAISVLKMAGGSGGELADYINSSSAIAIISGIFLSVGVAFVVGSIVQYFSRLLFSFHYEKRLVWVGGIWSGLALAALTYFLLIKGIKGASFVSDEFIDWILGNTWMLLGISFVFWTVLLQLLVRFFRINILRGVVLFGTFALAMAFAGNDLVNFIGVPIAGFESYLAWSATDFPAEEYSMEVLREPVRTKTYLLLAAGLIMIVTLWLSKKARSVTDTEVNLGRQHEGSERFRPNGLSRSIVWYTRHLGKNVQAALPDRWLDMAEKNFAEPEPDDKPADRPAFDLVRASVNLTVASMLIAFATSLKLPLSTTYVSFMVAMGTSLADRAWGRDSAVYRIAGVLNVIGGWFMTAIIAFCVSATFAWLIYSFGMWAIGALFLLAVFLISRTFALHRRREKTKKAREAFERDARAIPAETLITDTARGVSEMLLHIGHIYREAMEGLLSEDRSLLRQSRRDLNSLHEQQEELRYQLYGSIRRISEEQTEASRLYVLVYDLQQDILQSTRLIVDSCYEHVSNSMEPLEADQVRDIQPLVIKVVDYLLGISKELESVRFINQEDILEEKGQLFIALENAMARQIKGIKGYQYGMRNSDLYFSLQLETKDLIAVAARFVKLYDRLQKEGDAHLISR